MTACLHALYYHSGPPRLPRGANQKLLAAEHAARPHMYSNTQADAHIPLHLCRDLLSIQSALFKSSTQVEHNLHRGQHC